MHSNATYRGRANILKRPNRLNVRSGSVAGPPPPSLRPCPEPATWRPVRGSSSIARCRCRARTDPSHGV